MNIKFVVRALILATLGLAQTFAAFAQTTAFTYQGRLNDGAAPANGLYDLTFALHAAASGPAQVGGTRTNVATPVSDGLFSVSLDFGDEFPGENRWLEIGVKTNSGGAFTTLAPRQPLTAAPYAVTARRLSSTLPASQLTGTLPNAQLATTVSQLGQTIDSSEIVDGTITTNDLNPALLNGTFWKLGGNTGANPTNGIFLGTADNQPIELKINNQRGLRLEPTASDGWHVGIVNVLAGSPANVVGPGVYGAVISGGGAVGYVGILGTNFNRVDADFGSIGGGFGNAIQTAAYNSTIGGGRQNSVRANAYSSIIGGGSGNTIQSNANYSTIGGGYYNTIQYNSIQSEAGSSTIGGGAGNKIQSDAFYSTIGGGIQNAIQTNSFNSTIGGGRENTIQTNAESSTIGGGFENRIEHNAVWATIGGGKWNAIWTTAGASTIGGGFYNTIQNTSPGSTIGGGDQNTIQSGAESATIGGGTANRIQTNAVFSTIAGGNLNTIQTNADRSTIGGGYNNTIHPNADYSTIGGGYYNTIHPNAFNATIPGGQRNTATNFAFAAGRRAKATHTGTFVWGDSTDADIASASTNSVTLRASGGYRFFSNSGATAGVSLAAGGTSWAVISDRNVKKNFAPVGAVAVLEKLAALPITQWRYNWETEDTTPHIGPMAQDFKAAFYPGADDKVITTQEADGVALAAIQGLNQKVEAQRDELNRKQTEIAELKARLERLEELMNHKLNGGAQ